MIGTVKTFRFCIWCDQELSTPSEEGDCGVSGGSVYNWLYAIFLVMD